MSFRSLIEFNHDHAPRNLDEAHRLGEALMAYMRASDPTELPYGVLPKHRRHHTDPCPVAQPNEFFRISVVVEQPEGFSSDHSSTVGMPSGPDATATRERRETFATFMERSLANLGVASYGENLTFQPPAPDSMSRHTDQGTAMDREHGVEEREWTDQFGTHYEARAVGRDGRIFSETIMRLPDGWPPERAQAAARVLAARAAGKHA